MSFTEIIGQEQPISFLLKSFKSGRIYQSYLFGGPEGVGKFLVAKNFAKLLNCENSGSRPCDSCSSCIKIDRNNHPDVSLIQKDAFGFIGIDAIRDMQRSINLKPFEAKYKVFIVNEAHCLSSEAQGALLKTIEEPSKSSIIILITPNPSKMFATIISRCQKIHFSVLDTKALEAHLKKSYGLSEKEAHFLACFSGGRFSQALRYKDIRFLEEKNRVIDAVLGRRPDKLEDFLQDAKDKDGIKRLFAILISLFRDVLFVKIGLLGTMLINIDREKDLLVLKERYSFVRLEELISDILGLGLYLEQNINSKFCLAWLDSRILTQE